MAAADKKSGFNTFAVAASALAVLILVWALSLFLQGGYLAARTARYDQAFLAPPDTAVTGYLGAQQARLEEGYRWIDKDKGIVGVPIERAVDLVVARNGGR